MNTATNQNRRRRNCLSDPEKRSALPKPGDYELGSVQSRGAARAMFDSKKEKENVIQIVWVSPDGREEDGLVFKVQAANRQ